MMSQQQEEHLAASPVLASTRFGVFVGALPSAPRLRIAHIMLWTACTAVAKSWR